VEANLLLGGVGGADVGLLRQRATTLLEYQAFEMDVRLLVVRPNGEVAFDSDQTTPLVGQTMEAYRGALGMVLDTAAGRQRVVRRVVAPDRGEADPFARQIVVMAAGGRAIVGQPNQSPDALMLVSPPRRQGVTGRFLPPLLLILAIALGVAAVAGYLLSRRISAPVGRLTTAADAIAAGDLEQRVPDEGPDEIGRLVASFNAMSHQVAATARSQRKLLADIAHELRTPLTSVQGYAQALRDGVLADKSEEQRALATIGTEADRMGRLIRQLLDLARLESGQTKLTLHPVETRAALDRVQARFQPEAERRGVALLVAAAPGVRALADEERLHQVLDNLVGNALRHTPAGGEIVLAAAELPPDDSGRALVRLTVRDTGAGIAPERLPRIFDRFARGEDGAGREGFGLGLAIVKELVQAQGGTVSAASRLDEGTTFTVELPVAPDAA
jgi:two-component system sensor histidine kinase BaeS